MSILVYSDEGVSSSCVGQTRLSMEQIYGQRTNLISAAALLNGEWAATTSLFIMPGGRDLPYHQSLAPHGTSILRDFVEKGGTYLGICAGAYFGCAHIEFEKGGDLEVVGERDLRFFPGMAIGPAYGKGEFRYEENMGAQIGRIIFFDGSRAAAYFRGGCFFKNAHLFENVKVLARYEDLPDQPAAIVECKIGKGRAILSGVHLEYSPHDLVASSHKLRQIRTALITMDEQRIEGLKKILMTNR